MTYEELSQFDEDVLNFESPQLFKYLIELQKLRKEDENNKWLATLRQYVADRKVNLSANVP